MFALFHEFHVCVKGMQRLELQLLFQLKCPEMMSIRKSRSSETLFKVMPNIFTIYFFRNRESIWPIYNQYIRLVSSLFPFLLKIFTQQPELSIALELLTPTISQRKRIFLGKL